MGQGLLASGLWAWNVFEVVWGRGLPGAWVQSPVGASPGSAQRRLPTVAASAGYLWKLCF